MNYNPYDLIDLSINSKPMAGRPIAFDSEVANQMEMRNADGDYVKPTKVSTMCPDCGAGIELDIKVDEPPFGVLQFLCPHCGQIPDFVDPFQDPIASQRVGPHSLDPMVASPHGAMESDGLTVAERVPVREPAVAGAAEPIAILQPPKPKAPKKKKKPPKAGKAKLPPLPAGPPKASPRPQEVPPGPAPIPTLATRLVPLPAVEDLEEELDLDDLIDELEDG